MNFPVYYIPSVSRGKLSNILDYNQSVCTKQQHNVQTPFITKHEKENRFSNINCRKSFSK